MLSLKADDDILSYNKVSRGTFLGISVTFELCRFSRWREITNRKSVRSSLAKLGAIIVRDHCLMYSNLYDARLREQNI